MPHRPPSAHRSSLAVARLARRHPSRLISFRSRPRRDRDSFHFHRRGSGRDYCRGPKSSPTPIVSWEPRCRRNRQSRSRTPRGRKVPRELEAIVSLIDLLRCKGLRLQTRRGYEPLSAETEDALSIRLVRPSIAGKRVEGPVVIGDLLAGGSGDDAKLAR